MSTLGILKLPETKTIVNSNRLIVQQDNTTKQLLFGNLKFPLNNVTFAPTISSNQESLNYLTTTLYSLSTQILGLSGGVEGLIYSSFNNAFVNLTKKLYPVGSVKHTSNFVNPGTLIQGTTWVLISEGLYLAGAGSTDANPNIYSQGDKNKTIVTFTVGANTSQGEYDHLLIPAELPAHTHKISVRLNGTSTSTSYQNGAQAAPAMRLDAQITYATNSGTGGDQSHNNMPPLYGVYIWQRTA